MTSPALARSRPVAGPLLLVFLASFGPLALGACTDQTVAPVQQLPSVTPTAQQEGGGDDAPDAAPATTTATDASTPAAPTCATTYGSSLTFEYGRLDGTVHAVVLPGEAHCPSDDNHVIVQIDILEGTKTVTYPVVVNILSDLPGGDPAVRVAETTHDLVGPAWATGWHTDVSLDYGFSLDIHSTADFATRDKTQLGALVSAALPKGTKVSAYMQGFDTFDGGHKVHRNGHDQDGALVAIGSGATTWFLFHFANQTF